MMLLRKDGTLEQSCLTSFLGAADSVTFSDSLTILTGLPGPSGFRRVPIIHPELDRSPRHPYKLRHPPE